MKLRSGAMLLAGALLLGAALFPAVSEGRGGGPGWRGRCGQNQSCRQGNTDGQQDRKQLRDGSCGNPDCPQTPADCPGPCGGGRGPGSRRGSGAGSSSDTK